MITPKLLYLGSGMMVLGDVMTALPDDLVKQGEHLGNMSSQALLGLGFLLVCAVCIKMYCDTKAAAKEARADMLKLFDQFTKKEDERYEQIKNRDEAFATAITGLSETLATQKEALHASTNAMASVVQIVAGCPGRK